MKNILKYITAFTLLLAMAAGFSGCEEDTSELEYSGDAKVSFAFKTSDSYYVKDAADDSFVIEAGINIPAPQDLTFNIAVDTEKSSAEEGTLFSLESKTVTIKKGETVGSITVNGVFAETKICGADTLYINLVGEGTTDYDNTFELHIFRNYPFNINDFVGVYEIVDVSEYSGQGDPYYANVTLGDEPNTLLIEGLWGLGNQFTVTLNPETNAAVIPEQFAFSHATYGDVNITSTKTGAFAICDKHFEMAYKIFVPAGNFDNVISSYWQKIEE